MPPSEATKMSPATIPNRFVYTLTFVGKFGLWELGINRFRARFYRTRDEAMKCVTRYRRMLQSEQDRYESIRWAGLTPTEKVAEFDRYDQ